MVIVMPSKRFQIRCLLVRRRNLCHVFWLRQPLLNRPLNMRFYVLFRLQCRPVAFLTLRKFALLNALFRFQQTAASPPLITVFYVCRLRQAVAGSSYEHGAGRPKRD